MSFVSERRHSGNPKPFLMGTRYPKCSSGWFFFFWMCWFKRVKSAKVTSLDSGNRWHWRSGFFLSGLCNLKWPWVQHGILWGHFFSFLVLLSSGVEGGAHRIEFGDPSGAEGLFSYHTLSLWIWPVLLFCQIVGLGYFSKLGTLDILTMCYFSVSLPTVQIEKHTNRKKLTNRVSVLMSAPDLKM